MFLPLLGGGRGADIADMLTVTPVLSRSDACAPQAETAKLERQPRPPLPPTSPPLPQKLQRVQDFSVFGSNTSKEPQMIHVQ